MLHAIRDRTMQQVESDGWVIARQYGTCHGHQLAMTAQRHESALCEQNRYTKCEATVMNLAPLREGHHNLRLHNIGSSASIEATCGGDFTNSALLSSTELPIHLWGSLRRGPIGTVEASFIRRRYKNR